jgi:hypothetical protein
VHEAAAAAGSAAAHKNTHTHTHTHTQHQCGELKRCTPIFKFSCTKLENRMDLYKGRSRRRRRRLLLVVLLLSLN